MNKFTVVLVVLFVAANMFLAAAVLTEEKEITHAAPVVIKDTFTTKSDSAEEFCSAPVMNEPAIPL